jgi:hypothetical protein
MLPTGKMKPICRPVAATRYFGGRCRTLVELNISGIVAYRKADGSKRRTNY